MPKRPLKIPLALAFVTISATSAAVLTAASCGSDGPTADANTNCEVYCVYQGSDNGNCPFPTCATGSGHDQCPAGCIAEPIA